MAKNSKLMLNVVKIHARVGKIYIQIYVYE